MASTWRARVLVSALVVGAAVALPAPARADHDHCECAHDGGCDVGGCGYGGVAYPRGVAGYAYHGRGSGYYGARYAGGYRRTWSGYSVLRASRPELFAAYGDPCYVAYGRPCGYGFYRGWGYTRSLIRGGRVRYYGGGYGGYGGYGGCHCAIEDSSARPLVPYVATAAFDAQFEGRYEAAAESFQAEADADPSDARAWLGLAHASFGLKDWERAAKALRKAALLGALDPADRFDVEAAWLDRTAFEERLSALRARMKFRIFDDDARLVLGWVESGLGETEDAKADLGAVLRRSPDDPAARALLRKRAPAPTTAAPDVVAAN